MKPFAQKGTRPPAWLRWFANDVARGVVGDSMHTPVGCHFHHNSSAEWEVTVFIGSTEVVGGPKDGTTIASHIQLDIGHVIGLFDTAPMVTWQTDRISADDDLRQHISFEGIARSHHVWLRILSDPPEGFEPSRLLHTSSGVIEELW